MWVTQLMCWREKEEIWQIHVMTMKRTRQCRNILFVCTCDGKRLTFFISMCNWHHSLIEYSKNFPHIPYHFDWVYFDFDWRAEGLKLTEILFFAFVVSIRDEQDAAINSPPKTGLCATSSVSTPFFYHMYTKIYCRLLWKLANKFTEGPTMWEEWLEAHLQQQEPSWCCPQQRPLA